MKTFFILLSIFCLWCVNAIADVDRQIVIVVGNNPSTTEEFAAEQLQSYLLKVSGQRFVIRSTPDEDASNLLIAPVDLDKSLSPDTFVLYSQDRDLVFAGGGSRGKLYAVYEFVNRYLGIRWFSPDTKDEVIPILSGRQICALIKKGIHERQTPSFSLRMISADFGGPDASSMLGKLRFNAVVVGYEVVWTERNLRDLQKRGIDIVHGGHDTYRHFLSPEKYFVDHPEWSIVYRGKRIGTETLGNGATFCTTNKEALATFLDNLVAYLKKAPPEVKFIYPWPSDGAKWCECEECKKHSVSDRLMTLNISIAHAVSKIRPDIRVIHFAYQNHARPPVEIPTPKEMIVSYSAWGRNFAFAINEEGTKQEFRDNLTSWIGIHRETGCKLIVHSKLLRLFGMGFVLMPFDIVQREIKYLRNVGIDGFDFHRVAYGWWTKGLNDTVIAALAWNSDTNVDAITMS